MFKNILNTVIYPACLFFTVCIFITTFIATMVDPNNLGPNIIFMVQLFIFSIVLALINKIFTLKLISSLKFLLHFALTLTDFILMFIIFTGYYKNGATAFFIIVCFIIVYAVIMTAIMLIRGLFKEKKNDKSEYKKMF